MSREQLSAIELAQSLRNWVPGAADRTNFQNEIGLFDPATLSLVKISRTGVIDLFTGTNEGIRIDPEQHRIAVMSELVQIAADLIRLSAGGRVEVRAVENLLLHSDRDLLIEAAGTLRLKAKQIILETETFVDVI